MISVVKLAVVALIGAHALVPSVDASVLTDDAASPSTPHSKVDCSTYPKDGMRRGLA